MSRGEIITYIGAGEYDVQLTYEGRDRFNTIIASIDTAIASMESDISDLEDELADLLAEDPIDVQAVTAKRFEIDVANLKLASLNKRKYYLEDNFPDDPTIRALCVDAADDLSGTVGIIDIDGTTDQLFIRPGFTDDAVYDGDRDGQLMPSIGGSPEQVLVNWMIFPGWQKFKPTYRTGKIIADSLNFVANTCSVCLDTTFSSQQNLNINQDSQFGDCEVSPPQGWTNFAADYSSHPFVTNTEQNNPLYVTAAVLDLLQTVQADVNNSHEYESDASGWGIGEVWNIMDSGETGDCEDFALTKMQALLDAGFPVGNMAMATCFTEGPDSGYHAVLMIRTQNLGNLILDNRYDEVIESDLLPYSWHMYQKSGSTWAEYSTLLEDIEIEYRDCHAQAFADLDEVIVEFEDQEWSNAKVIGFVSDPSVCGADFWIFGTYSFHYSYSSQSWSADAEAPDVRLWSDCSAVRVGANAYIFGGVIEEEYEYPYVPPPPDDMLTEFSILDRVYDQKTDIPTAWQFTHGFAIGSFCFVVGGFPRLVIDTTQNGSDDNQRYNTLLDSWSDRNDMPEDRWDHYTFSIANYGFIGGGLSNHSYNSLENFADDFRQFDDDTNSYSLKGTPLSNGYRSRGFTLLNRGYVVSGFNEDQLDASDHQAYQDVYTPSLTDYYRGTGTRETLEHGYYTFTARRYDYPTDAWSLIEAWPSTEAILSRNTNAGAGSVGYQMGEYLETPPGENPYSRSYMSSLEANTETWSDELDSVYSFYHLGYATGSGIAK